LQKFGPKTFERLILTGNRPGHAITSAIRVEKLPHKWGLPQRRSGAIMKLQ